MPMISFSFRGQRGPAYELIRKGEKTQTIRKMRRIRDSNGISVWVPAVKFKPGDRVRLYWLSRIPIKNKPVHLIGTAIIDSVQTCARVELAEASWFKKLR